MYRSVVESVVPARLGTPFRWLLASSWVSNIADGLQVAAGPLLVASETRDPFLVSLAAVLQYLPFLLFGLFAGVVADRVDRRRLVALADLCRAAVVAVLVVTVVTDEVNIAVVLAAMFLLGVGETFADTTTSTLLPMIVAKANLGIANARLITGIVTFNQLAGPPVGALLFSLGRALPFVTQVICMILSVLLVLRVRLPAHGRDPAGEHPTIRKDILEGLRWVMAHAAIRTLTLTIVTFNVTFGAAWSVLVLYSLERLGMGEVGFGLLTSALALGGLAGTLTFGWLERHVSLGHIMRGGLIIETLTHLVLAVNTVPAVAMVVFFVFGAHAFIWGTISATVRQRAVPTQMQGRVASLYLIGVTGGMVFGSVLGGLIASRWGITAPFWFAFVGSALFLALIWRQLMYIAHADEEIVDETGTTATG